jgi:hypothetical protein
METETTIGRGIARAVMMLTNSQNQVRQEQQLKQATSSNTRSKEGNTKRIASFPSPQYG